MGLEIKERENKVILEDVSFGQVVKIITYDEEAYYIVSDMKTETTVRLLEMTPDGYVTGRVFKFSKNVHCTVYDIMSMDVVLEKYE